VSTTNPDKWQVIGTGNGDLTGAGQIARARPIGGGATADGQDETQLLVENGTFSWSGINRAMLAELTTYGNTTTNGAPIFTTSTLAAAAYDDIAECIFTLGASRGAVTVYLDFEGCDIELEAFDSNLSLLDNARATSASRTQTSVTLDYGNDLDAILRISIKRHVDPTNGKLYSVRLLEDKSGTTTDASHGFKAQDDAAYAARASYSAFLLQGIDLNNEAAHKGRLRRYSTWWPDEETTGGGELTQPLIASHLTLAFPLAMHRVTPGCDQIKVRLWLTVTTATMNFGLGFMDVEGSGLWQGDRDTTTTQAVTGSNVNVDLTVDVSGMAGRTIFLALLIRSELGAEVTGSPQSYSIATTPISGLNVLDLNADGAHGFTLSASERYVIWFEAGGAGTQPDISYPTPRTCVFNDDPNLYVWPLFRQPNVINPLTTTTDISIAKLGFCTLKSLAIIEEQVTARALVRNSLLTGLPTAANIIQRLYARQRQLWRDHTRVWHSIGGYDPGHVTDGQTITLWNDTRAWDQSGGDSGWYDMGATMVGPYDASLDEDGATQTRSHITVRGVVQVCYPVRAGVVNVNIRLKLASYTGPTWATNVVTSSTVIARANIIANFTNTDPNDTADLSYYRHTGSNLAYHYLQGGLGIGELINGRHGLAPFSITITDTQTSATARLLRLQMQGDPASETTFGIDVFNNDGIGIFQADTALRLVAWTAYTREAID
tara:strand:+ start:21746 stop:23899 length:2154 start_codon:yes stop_codon:yes gene_type:complete